MTVEDDFHDDGIEPGDFRTYQAGLLPPWMDESGRDWAGAQGTQKDAIAEGATEAVKARFLGTCADDGLPYTGRDSQIERMPGEAMSTYRARLFDRWRAWRTAATDPGIIGQLAAMRLAARCKRNNEWDWDGHPGNTTPWWARMWVVIDPPHHFTAAPLCGGGPVCGDGTLCGIGGATADEIAQIRRLAKKWTSSHVLLVNEIVVISGSLCGDGPVSGDGTPCGGEAAYLEGW